MNAIFSRKSVRNAVAMAALAVPIPALAANHGYIGPDGGFWSVATNWAPNGVPVNGESAFISAGNSDYTVNFNGNYAGAGLVFLSVDSTGFGTAIINQSANAMVQSGGQMQIGYSGRGHYIQSGGTNSSTDMFLGGIAGSVGTYDLSGSATFTVTDASVGSSGTGYFNQSGGTFNPTTLNIGWDHSGAYGSYSMTGGAVNVGTLRLGGSGTGYFQQNGFSTNVNVASGLQTQANGSYTLSNGNLTAPLFNTGSFYQSGGNFNVSGINYSSLIVSGGYFNVTSGGFYNNALMNVSGGSIITNGNTFNYGQISINGSASLGGSAAFNNFSLINLNSGILTLNGTGPISNSGNINLAAGWGIFVGSNLTNTGTISLNGGQVTGSATLVNRYGGTVRGAGLIASPFDNQGGRLLLTDGTTNILQPFNTRGIIELASASASLTGGIITNNGQIFGHGSITNDINNSTGSSIEANGGNLILAGVVSNFGGGTMVADDGAKLFFPGGITTSSGLINLQGGTFDNNGIPINNTGQISGFGTIRTGGLANNGSMTLTGGFSTVNGAVFNSAAKQIKIAYNPALFTGAVTNNGTFKTTSTTVTFSGSYTENGTFISDPSDNYFFDVFLNAPGSWTGGAGDRFFVKGTLDWSGGSMNGNGAQTFNQGSATLHDAGVKTLNGWTFNNEKPLTMSGGNIDMGNGALINNTSSFEIQGGAGIINSLGAAATFANQGTLRKTGARTISSIAALVTNNNGNIDVPTGILSLDGGLNIASATTLPKTGAGDLTISGPQSHGVGAQLTASSGSIHLNSNAGTPATAAAAASATLTLNVSGNATVVLGGNQDLKALNIPIANADNQSLDLSTPGTPGAFNAIRVYAADLATAKTTLWSAIKNANGPGSLTPVDGIFDSGKIGHAGSGIGLARINDAHGDSHVQIRLAKTGDLNLDGNVTISDFIDLASNFNTSGPNITWQEGDLNYDGQVTISDFIDLASNFGSSYSGSVLPTSASDLSLLSSFASSIGVDPGVIGSAVPEPGSLATAAAATLLLMQRRRRQIG